MHADYLEIRKNFLSHAMPKGYQGMPSDIRSAGPKGMRQKSIDKEAKNNPMLRGAKRLYSAAIDVAKRYNDGKISFQQAESLFEGINNSFQTLRSKLSDASVDTAFSAFLSGGVDSELAGIKNLGFSDSDIRELKLYFAARRNGGGHFGKGSKAGMPSNIRR